RCHRHLAHSPNNNNDFEPLLTGEFLIVVSLFLFTTSGGLTRGLAWLCKLRSWLGEWSDACRQCRRSPCIFDDEGVGEGDDDDNEIKTPTSGGAIEVG
ncbi:unnamed protein product, partial [Ectocarpus sp. 12 AP-2014]